MAMCHGTVVATALLMVATLQGCGLTHSSFQTTWTGGVRHGKCSTIGSHGHRMDCGKDVEVCGVLTLESGEGKGAYTHPQPVVHGLWPQTSNFGTSECERPEISAANPTKVYPCFDTQGSSSSAVWFQKHEWEKHGVCAGVKNADDFFRQVCQLSSAPLQVMAGSRAAGQDLVDMADQLQRAGYCVYHIDSYNKQLQLSACQDEKGIWHLADVNSFPQVCGGGGGSPAGGGEIGGVCVTGQRGPRCSKDADCWGKANCQRCAHSGYCTDVPLTRSLSEHFTGLWQFQEGTASTTFLAVNVMIASVYLLATLTIVRSRSQRGQMASMASSPLIQAEAE
ncbi:unnamed protein product [Cladocopium goreaui]|uniref:Uncharacterized protein n=1 Tax=Cladocopium goreaui TaxID=2562237 RepID=A0A9P1BY51_9DINO|nr:unnamed protein product [Cladocopium goreaui]